MNDAGDPRDHDPADDLPHNFEAEMALLAAILSNNKAFDRVAEFLRPEHFADDRHAMIFEACASLISRGETADPIVLHDHFAASGALEGVGGPSYLSRIAAAVVSVSGSESYGRTVHDRWIRRQAIEEAGAMISELRFNYDLETPALSYLDTTMGNLAALVSAEAAGKGPRPLSVGLAEANEQIGDAYRADGALVGLPTGLTALDHQTGGLVAPDLSIIAGRPGQGKTALAMTIAVATARAGTPVLIFSLEMSAAQLASRLLSQGVRIPTHILRRGEIKPTDFISLNNEADALGALPIYIDDTPGLSVHLLRTRARTMVRSEGVGLVIVDYLQLLHAPDSKGRRLENMVQEVTVISGTLKETAKEMGVPLVALSQLNRGVEMRDDKRPLMSDLRSSGSIEQDADMVAMLYREEYYLNRTKPTKKESERDDAFAGRKAHWDSRMGQCKGKGEIIVVKARHGPEGTVHVGFDGPLTMFHDLEADAQADMDEAARFGF